MLRCCGAFLRTVLFIQRTATRMNSSKAPVFSSLPLTSANVLKEGKTTTAFRDLAPILPGHTLVVPNHNVARLRELLPSELEDLFETVSEAQRHLTLVYG